MRGRHRGRVAGCTESERERERHIRGMQTAQKQQSHLTRGQKENRITCHRRTLGTGAAAGRRLVALFVCLFFFVDGLLVFFSSFATEAIRTLHVQLQLLNLSWLSRAFFFHLCTAAEEKDPEASLSLLHCVP